MNAPYKPGLSPVSFRDNMRKSLKITAAVTVLFLAFGAIVLSYATSQNASTSYNGQNSLTMYTADNATNVQSNCKHMGMNGAHPWAKRFLENATITTVNGTVVSEFKGMLILDTGLGEVRILMPKYWSVDNEVVGRSKLLNSTYSFSGSGENITATVLESKMFSNTSFSIEVMVGYEITNATGTNAYAVLPFNIIPNS
jgi:hypothetical protein